jgi:hypothetical protein
MFPIFVPNPKAKKARVFTRHLRPFFATPVFRTFSAETKAVGCRRNTRRFFGLLQILQIS